MKLSENGEIVSAIITYHLFLKVYIIMQGIMCSIIIILKVKALMDQFKDGLEAAGVLKYMKKHYHLLTPLFVCEMQPFTASKGEA